MCRFVVIDVCRVLFYYLGKFIGILCKRLHCIVNALKDR